MLLRGGAFHRAWPALEAAALAHRRTLARHTRVVAVVGSLGKTTTARAVSAALGGDPEALGRNYMSYLAAAMMRIRPGDRHAVLEVGIGEPGIMARYARLVRPEVAVVTSIGHEHHSTLPTLEVTREEKAAMVRALRPSGRAVLNGDDENVAWMATQTRAEVRTFGFGAGNDVRARDVAIDWPHGTRFTVHADGVERRVRLRLLGEHMVPAALAALCVALAEGVGLDAAIARLEVLAPAPGRLETVALPGGAFLIRDEFKGTPETIDTALAVLAGVPAAGRRIVVLGDVEEPLEPAEGLYEDLGRRVAEVADHALFVHFNAGGPRYADGARRAGMGAASAIDARGGAGQAARLLRSELRPGDVVLVKGAAAQRLDRVALALEGHEVRCELRACGAKVTRCGTCPMLERGWGGLRAVT